MFDRVIKWWCERCLEEQFVYTLLGAMVVLLTLAVLL